MGLDPGRRRLVVGNELLLLQMARWTRRPFACSPGAAALLVVAAAVPDGLRMSSTSASAELFLLLHQRTHRPHHSRGLRGQGGAAFRFAGRSAEELQALLVLP